MAAEAEEEVAAKSIAVDPAHSFVHETTSPPIVTVTMAPTWRLSAVPVVVALLGRGMGIVKLTYP